MYIYMYIYIPLQSLSTKWSPHANNLLTIEEEFFHEIEKYNF